jgi:S-DNA-T family DNA segregation ATPase FtsK/SpoIIIE
MISAYSLTPFVPPPLSLLEKDKGKPETGDIKANANIIKRTLQNFGISVEMDEISIGPSVTRYALKPAEGVKLSKIVALNNDLALALAAHPIRIEAPIPGKSLVGIEIPNTTKTTVGLGTLLSSEEYQDSEKPLLISLGKGISGKSYFANLAKAPHMLIAGATGSGKSVTIHAVINSLLFRNSPENLKFIMIDPKRVELTLYNKIPHLLTPVITDAKKAILALKWAAKEMSRRYDILEKCSVRDIDSYHKNVVTPAVEKKRENKDSTDALPESMPYIVIVLDELADIMQTYPRELESAIVRLAQMSRAIGIHLIVSTQRPSVNVITGLIKANIPTRIALQVSSQIDSRTILDTGGAEKLLGAGDMLYLGGEMAKPQRLQSAYITESEVKRVVKHLADTYKDEIMGEINLTANEPGKDSIFEASLDSDDSLEDEDELLPEAKEIVLSSGKASTSWLQRKLGIGYSRAAKLIDLLEEKGIVGPANGSKAREVYGSNTPSDTLPDENTDIAIDNTQNDQP